MGCSFESMFQRLKKDNKCQTQLHFNTKLFLILFSNFLNCSLVNFLPQGLDPVNSWVFICVYLNLQLYHNDDSFHLQ